MQLFSGSSRVVGAVLILQVALAGCRNDGPYFGDVTPPDGRRLVYINGDEPGSVDPGTFPGGREMPIINALFEGLTRPHPATLQPMAGLATHYDANAELTQFTFYLRGHPTPRGVRLPNTDTLHEEYLAGGSREDFARGHTATPDNVPARWSDGVVITADAFVYSWRRVVDPSTASPNAATLYVIRNAEAVNSGRLPVEQLGVRAIDAFTLQVDLESPTPFFLRYQTQRPFYPVPRHVIAAAAARGRESSWTAPDRLVTSGAFMLAEHRPYDRVVVKRNRGYYEAGTIDLDEIVFLPVGDVTAVNLYKAGLANAMAGGFFPLEFTHAMAGKRDFGLAPILFRNDYVINTTRPPFDNVLVRYALSMATDRAAITRTFGRGDLPAAAYIPEMEGYEQIRSLPIDLGDRTYDVLAYDPAGARALLARAGYPEGRGPDGERLRIDITSEGNLADEILQQQWASNLGVDALYWFPPARMDWVVEWGWLRVPSLSTLILPAITLATGYAAAISRMVRGAMLDVLGQPFVRAVQAKGVSRVRAIFRHALRIALLPVVSFSGPALAFLMTGTVVVERVFAVPGLGRYFIDAALNRDYFLILGLTAFGGIALMIANLLVDLASAWLDPRIVYD